MRTFGFLVLLCPLVAAGCGTREPRPPSVAELTEMLKKEDPPTQILAANWVVQLGPKAQATRPALIAALKSPDLQVRQNVALALGKLGPDAAADAVPALSAALNDPEILVQQAAATALGEFGPAASSAIPALEAFSRTPDPCNSAQSALKKIRS